MSEQGKLIIHQPLGMDSIVVDLKWHPEKIEFEGKIIYDRGLTLKDIDNAFNAMLANEYRRLQSSTPKANENE